MSYRIISEDIKNNALARMYLFHGPEEYLKSRALSQLTQAQVDNEYKDLNYIIIDGASAGIDDIIASCETLPFLSYKRLVVVMDYIGFSGKKSADEDKLAGYFSNVPETTCLVMYNRGDINKDNNLLKKAAKVKTARVVHFDRLNKSELIKWVDRLFRKAGKFISNGDINYFLSLTSNDLEIINNEILKLAAYSGEQDTITREAIDKLVTPVPEHTVFQLVDMVAAKKSGKALELLDELIDKGEPVLLIITMIARQIKNIIYYKYFTEMGHKNDVICKKLGLHPYVIDKCSSQSKGFTTEQLKQAHDECLKLNYGIKAGTVRDRLGLELLILNMCK